MKYLKQLRGSEAAENIAFQTQRFWTGLLKITSRLNKCVVATAMNQLVPSKESPPLSVAVMMVYSHLSTKFKNAGSGTQLVPWLKEMRKAWKETQAPAKVKDETWLLAI